VSTTSDQTGGVRIERSRAALTFTLENPDRGNEITGRMFDAMLAALSDPSSADARVLRIRATGPQFCVGRERAGVDEPSIRAEVTRLVALKRAVRESPLISVAEVQGDALGFGFGLAIVSDFTLVADHAKLGFPEMLFGLAPLAIMAYLHEYALPKHVFPMVLLGEPITAARALQIGLVNDVVATGDLPARVDALAAKLLALDAHAARNCKAFFRLARERSFEENAQLAIDGLTLASLR
jgi:methylglutaconyl-CoA hydratase